MFLAVLLLSGGASRADAAGQAVARGAAWLALVVVALVGERPSFARPSPVAILLGAATALVLVQLIPLPPTLWQALPGRSLLAEAAVASGQAQPWRPWSMAPAATLNAASSLIVPLTVLLLVDGIGEEERRRLPGLMLCVVAAAALIGLLQLSGTGFTNPLIDGEPGMLIGPFANRNHFALFLGLGCLLAPAWAFLDGRRTNWRAPVGFGLVLLFLLMILVTGSRAGMALGVVALATGLVVAHRGIRHQLGHHPAWVYPVLVAALLGVVALAVAVSVANDRAASITRALSIDPAEDLRGQALPTLVAMVRDYFPFGTGFGTFDQVFRIHEPLALLRPTYFNRAHNDVIEVVLDGGLPALLLLIGALLWWGGASIRAWRGEAGRRATLPKLGSAMLLLVLVASIFDYPARTPLVMAIVVLAAVALAGPARPPARALPPVD